MRAPNTIDFWRGIALMEILVNHIPGNSLSRFTHRQYGWSDAAEALIFLAGLAFAMRCGNGAPSGKIWPSGEWRRTFNIYIWHVVFSLILMGVYYVAYLNGQSAILSDNRTTPLHAETFAGVLLLSHQLRYFDILPLYIVLFAAGPLIVWLARRSLGALLCSSLALYAATRILGFGLPAWPGTGVWYFNPFAWQALFVIGYVCGARREAVARLMESRALLVAACVVLLVAFVAMLAGVPNERVHERTAVELALWGKSSLGPARLVHFLARRWWSRGSGALCCRGFRWRGLGARCWDATPCRRSALAPCSARWGRSPAMRACAASLSTRRFSSSQFLC